MSASIFAAVEMAPRDPILGLTEQFNADPNPAKVNLGVGVYFDDAGKLPLLACVKAAEQQLGQGVRLNQVTRHMLGLANGRRGARQFRQILSVDACRKGAGPEVIARALDAVVEQELAA